MSSREPEGTCCLLVTAFEGASALGLDAQQHAIFARGAVVEGVGDFEPADLRGPQAQHPLHEQDDAVVDVELGAEIQPDATSQGWAQTAVDPASYAAPRSSATELIAQ